MTRRLLIVLTAFAAAVSLAVATSAAAAQDSAASAGPAPEIGYDTAVFVDDFDDVEPPRPPTTDNDGARSGRVDLRQRKFCNYETKVDNPHISSRNRGQVSAHGHWIYHNGTCTTAKVTIWLYHRRTSSWYGSYWALTDTDTVRGMPRNARLSQRANARYTCQSHDRAVGFWAIVDVDIDDHSDPADLGYSRQFNVNCLPW